MAALDGKYHIKLDGKGYIIARNRNNVSYYQKKRAPSFVNKFGSGDSSYRDSTFWQFFAQINWRNGCKQEKFDDGGKFWKSNNVDVNELSKIKLSKVLTSAGQIEAGTKVNIMAAWRGSQNWWNANYSYRQKITVTAPATKQVPVGYPIKVTIDTAALQTAGKVRADRKDWRIVYWNGSDWEDLTRDYITTVITFFATKKAITAGESDNNYYAYYGYAAESTDKQPTTDAQWNEVYVPEVDDAYVKFLVHFKEGTGNTAVDTDAAYDFSKTVGTTTWGTGGRLGKYITLNGSTIWGCAGAADLDVGSFTFQWNMKFIGADNAARLLMTQDDAGGPKWRLSINSPRKFTITKWYGGSDESHTTVNSIIPDTTNWYHYAITYDGAKTFKIYRNGSLIETLTWTQSGIKAVGSPWFRIGNDAAEKVSCHIQHIRYDNVVRTSFPHALVTEPTTSYGSETTTQPPASSFDLYAGLNNGKIYKWDGNITWTEQFDCRELDGYETGGDTDNRIGDTAGTEYQQAQGFKLTAEEVKSQIGGIRAYLKNATSCLGDITVRIEGDNAGVPDGVLANANATGTIPTGDVNATYGWVTCNFATSFALTASTQYWLVLSVAAQANDVGYDWQSDASSPTYSDGTRAYHDGSWTADSNSDLLFNILSRPTSVNCSLISSVGGTQKLLIGTGAIDSETNGDARLYSFTGTTWALEKTFNTTTECQITSLCEFVNKVYLGIGPQAKVYETSDLSTFTISKDIDVPQKPGYVYALVEYNQMLYAMGGSPEFMSDKYYGGFCWVYDGTTWQSLYPFDHTVIKSASFYDAFLFMGTYHGQLYVYNMSTLDPLFNLKDDYEWKNQIDCMKYFDDKLFIGLYPQEGSGETNVGVMVFDRHGISLKHTISGITGITCLEQVNNVLMIGTGDDGYVYKLNPDVYVEQGWVQSSYFDANLPSIDKLYNEVSITYKPLPTGASIKLYYRYKEEDSWTELGTANIDSSTTATFSFAAGSYSRKISLKYELNTTDTSVTPELNEVILKYSLFPQTKWLWSIRILCKNKPMLLDKTRDTRTAAQIRAELETEIATKELHTLIDLDGTTYTVLFNDLDQNSWVINQDDGSESTIPISLIQA